MPRFNFENAPVGLPQAIQLVISWLDEQMVEKPSVEIANASNLLEDVLEEWRDQ